MGATNPSLLNLSAGTTSGYVQTAVFSNSNGVSFGLNGNTITASVDVGGGGLTNVKVSAGTVSYLGSALTFGDANGISFGLNASTLTASHNGLTSQSNQNVTAGNGGFAFQTLSFSNVNGISFGTSAGSAITASHNAITTGMASNRGSDFVQATAAFAGTSASGTIASGGISVSIGPYITTGALSNHSHGASGANGSFAFQTLSFSNVNGISFGTSAGNAITASHNALTTAAASDHSHGNPTLNLTNLSGTTASNSAGFTLSLSAAAPGGAAITQSIGMSTQTAGGATGGTTGYATGDDVLYHFVPGSNITMSQSVNGASATLSIYGPAAGGGATLSAWNPYPNNGEWLTSGIGNASLWINARDVVAPFRYDRMVMPIHFSQATNATLSVSNTVAWGWYSRNVSTLSLYKSGSGTFSINGSGTASSANNSGIRLVSFGSTDTITEGNYYLGVVWRTSSGGANASLSHLCVSQFASTISGYIGLATNSRMYGICGVWTSTTAGPVPNSVAFSDIRGQSSAFLRPPICWFTSQQITF